jgi:hypothetical protein
MYFQFFDFYKRDVYFEYCDDKNDISQYDFIEGIKIETSNVLLYEIDKIDSYIKSYDLLPTFGPPLVSDKFRKLFADLQGSELDFFATKIIDIKGRSEDGFYALNILHKIPCLDRQRSIIQETSYGTLKIKKLFIVPDSLNSKSIVRMEEHQSYILTTKEFKNRCKDANLQGMEFVEEGHSIYKDL